MRPECKPLHAILTPCPHSRVRGAQDSGFGTIPLLGAGQRRGLHASLASLNSGLSPRGLDLVYVNVEPLLFAPGSFFGISAATRTLAGEGLMGRQEQRIGVS